MAVRAKTSGVGISPKRLRPVVDAVRGKGVEEALRILQFIPSPAAAQVAKVVRSAMANAENNLLLDAKKLRGRAAPIIKRRSHITVVVDEEVS